MSKEDRIKALTLLKEKSLAADKFFSRQALTKAWNLSETIY